VARYLPAERYRLIPMYSMSTETIETISHFGGGHVSFLPLASRVLYEFIKEGVDDLPENLLTADQLQPGEKYSMVVSDSYGLRRYQTGDLFLCKRFVGRLPDLWFVSRLNLEYSFTGEKLTNLQVMSTFQRLREEFPWLRADEYLTCVPSHPTNEPTPHYKIILIGSAKGNDWNSYDELARRCDELFGEFNSEYKSKRESRRLERVRFSQMSQVDFANRIGANQQGNESGAQFKFLPLYRQTWESAGEVSAPGSNGDDYPTAERNSLDRE
jgi:hypothetical protein